VSPSKTSEQRLSEACFRSMVEHGADVITLQRHDGIVVYVSPSVHRVLGYTPEEWMGGRLGHMVHPDDQELRARIIAELNATPGLMRQGAVRWQHKNGTWRWMQITIANLTEDPDVQAIVMTQHDITEMREAEARYRIQIEHAPEAIVVVDVDLRRIVEANPNAERLFKMPRQQIFNVRFGELSPPQQPDGRPSDELLAAHYAQTIDGKTPVFEWMVRDAEGVDVPCEVRLVRLPAGDKRLVRGSILDISERKRLEQIRARSTELELQNRRIRESSRLKSEFLANMSHELRTPLNAIIGFAELLYEGRIERGSQKEHEFLGTIGVSARHLLHLIDDVLDLSKVEAGRLELRPEPVDPAQLSDEVCDIMRPLADEKHIGLSLHCEPVHDVTLDPARYKQVLYNFLSNAIKFTPDGGSVTVRVRPDGNDWLRMEVEDTGIGIAPWDIGLLFVEFQQLDTGLSKKHEGTGLGLALTKRLVEAQGGSVGVASTVGKGSTFHALLPRRAMSGTASAGRRTPSAVRKGAAPRVLVIEDDMREQTGIVELLMRASYAVDTADNGTEALARLRSHRFDAVTLELLLPDMSGLDLLAAIRTTGDNAAVPVIVLTELAEELALVGIAVHQILRKPLDGPKLLDALASAVKR
jgi:PAS domain S-box-containing protein